MGAVNQFAGLTERRWALVSAIPLRQGFAQPEVGGAPQLNLGGAVNQPHPDFEDTMDALREALMFWPNLIAELLALLADIVGAHNLSNRLFNWSQR